MSLSFNPDGTITANLETLGAADDTGDRQPDGNVLAVTLRRPRLRDLRELWEAFDRIAEEQRNAASDDDTPAKQAIRNMAGNNRWYHEAFDRLSPNGVPWTDIEEPAYLGGAKAAIEMLTHWQDVPLAPGVTAATGGPVPIVPIG